MSRKWEKYTHAVIDGEIIENKNIDDIRKLTSKYRYTEFIANIETRLKNGCSSVILMSMDTIERIIIIMDTQIYIIGFHEIYFIYDTVHLKVLNQSNANFNIISIMTNKIKADEQYSLFLPHDAANFIENSVNSIIENDELVMKKLLLILDSCYKNAINIENDMKSILNTQMKCSRKVD
jgi:hypothetical protein